MKKSLIVTVFCTLLIFSTHLLVELFVPAQGYTRYSEIEIPSGTTFRQAVKILSDEKLIRDANVFLLLGRLTGTDRKISAGFYSIWGGMSPLDIFKALQNGQIIEYEIRILEGENIFDIADRFSDIGLIARGDFIELAGDPYLLLSHEIESKSIEGYIYPDTYKIPKGISPENAIGMMISRMREKYSDELLVRSAELGMTENEVLTLASIIEKEAVLDSERPIISAVYHNRLKKKMRLQADPTAIYGVKSTRKKITKSDLLRKTPYNTYTIEGLPPGPIASPSLKSIVAALHPADVPYLYFVSKDDMSHYFSKTAREHLEAVKLYRELKEQLKKNAVATSRDDAS
jgi:UPF0755 protein